MRKTYPFLNDLQNLFEKENLLQSLSEISQVLEDQINAYLKLIVLFCTRHNILMSESKVDSLFQ